MHAPGVHEFPADGRESLRQWLSKLRARRALQVLAGWLVLLAAAAARAAFLSGDALDTAADWLALFVIFVVETVFLFPWAIIYKQLALFGLLEMLVFLGILIVGYIWIIKKGALDWA